MLDANWNWKYYVSGIIEMAANNDLARDEGVLLLDLQDKSWRKFNTYRDKEELISIFGYGQDNSHFNSYGANVVAYWVKELICASGDQSFCSQFR